MCHLPISTIQINSCCSSLLDRLTYLLHNIIRKAEKRNVKGKLRLERKKYLDWQSFVPNLNRVKLSYSYNFTIGNFLFFISSLTCLSLASIPLKLLSGSPKMLRISTQWILFLLLQSLSADLTYLAILF